MWFERPRLALMPEANAEAQRVSALLPKANAEAPRVSALLPEANAEAARVSALLPEANAETPLVSALLPKANAEAPRVSALLPEANGEAARWSALRLEASRTKRLSSRDERETLGLGAAQVTRGDAGGRPEGDTAMATTRGFGAFDLVRLPRLDGHTAQSLAQAVLAAAAGASLSDGAKEALADVGEALAKLGEATRGRLPTGADDGPRVKLADMAVDAAWSATYEWLGAWSKLPHAAGAKTAATLLARLFPNKRGFLRLKVVKEWAESEARLTLIAEQGLEASFTELGGAAFLTDLRATHAAYGEALGITKAAEVAPDDVERLGDALTALIDALRGYVLQASAMARKADPASGALVDRLLLPITSWASTPIARGGALGEEGAAGEDGEGEETAEGA
jgi:hypothetical protein